MPVFSYRAINDDSKEVRGSVDAPDLDSARKVLEDQHLEVVELYEAARSHDEKAGAASAVSQPMLKTTFAFEGKDTSDTVRRGTIQAENKFQAFERLKQDQKLFLTMLSPLGITPQYRDNDLENWQKSATIEAKPASPQQTPIKQAVVVPPAAPKAAPKIGFTLPEEQRTLKTPPPAPVKAISTSYHSLLTTLRLYAGWLLAWYGLFVALGYYVSVRALPWDIPFVQAFYESSLIFSFVVAIFLFLLMSAMHRALGGRLFGGIALTIVGIAAFAAVRLNI